MPIPDRLESPLLQGTRDPGIDQPHELIVTQGNRTAPFESRLDLKRHPEAVIPLDKRNHGRLVVNKAVDLASYCRLDHVAKYVVGVAIHHDGVDAWPGANDLQVRAPV